jgi:hypothetical protein
MIALKVEKIGDRVALILTEDALELLNAEVGGVVNLEIGRDGAITAAGQEAWVDDPHARGRAFLKRYNRAFERLES